MLYAIQDGKTEKVLATPQARAKCPSCEQPVIAKCGEIVTWHWAHLSADCDTWAEGETPWHMEWKSRFKNVEVTMRRDGEWHRADVVTEGGWVVEFQHSYISPENVRAREDFYRNMIWVFDARDARKPVKYDLGDFAFEDARLVFRTDSDNRNDDNYVTFRWKHPRKIVARTTRNTYLDLGDGWLLQVGNIYMTGMCGGWGYLVSYDKFMAMDN